MAAPNAGVFDLKSANQDYRRVEETFDINGKDAERMFAPQIVRYALEPGEKLPNEKHKHAVQVLVVVEGQGMLTHWQNERKSVTKFSSGQTIVIAAGTFHEIVNTSDDTVLRLFSVYSSAQFPSKLVDKRQEDSDKRKSAVCSAPGCRVTCHKYCIVCGLGYCSVVCYEKYLSMHRDCQ